MVWVIGILKFIFGFLGMASMTLFILSCISGIINPNMATNDKGEVIETGANFRYILGLIMSISWAIVIALS